ncbi:MAG: transposase [Gemmataceae bacterium]|nr:transposase [Gemmataceae bacterium]
MAVSVHYVSPNGHYPLDARLYLPDSWLGDKARLDKAGVPKPERRSRTKPEIALDLLDRVRAEGVPGRAVVADAGYGVSGDFRDGLERRGLTYIVGVTADFVVFTDRPRWVAPARPGRGRPRTRPGLAADNPRPVAVGELAGRIRRRKVTWREGTKGKLAGRFAWLRVWPGQGWSTGACAGAGPIWLLIEEQADGQLKYAFSNLPADASCGRAVRLWKSRWPVEQGYQQLKEELGLDHFEGRSWRGFHHHVAMTLLAYGFLLLERHRLTEERNRKKATRPRRVKGGGAEPALTLPGVRRALQLLLRPWAKPDCAHCRGQQLRPIQV